MDRNAILNDLKQAESHVRLGESALRQQEGVLADLKSRGHDTRMAETLYRSFAGLQDCYRANRAWLSAALAQTRAERQAGTPMDTGTQAADNAPSSAPRSGRADG